MLDQLDLSRFVKLVRNRSGIRIEGARLADLERGIARALEVTGQRDPDSLYRLLDDPGAGRDALKALMSEITIGETHFFRHAPQMESLERHVLPDLIARRRDRRRLRIWSAGCSTGEEPYSLAVLLRRALPDIGAWDVTILATDVDVEALETARDGVYGPWSFRGVPPDVDSRYFLRSGSKREILPALREMVTFEYLNLAEDPYPSLLNKTAAIDLIVCRNVFIYVDRSTTERAAAGFYEALTDGGWLLVGPAEPSQETFGRFDPHNLPGVTLYRKPPSDVHHDDAYVPEPEGGPAASSADLSVVRDASTAVPTTEEPGSLAALERRAESDRTGADAPYSLARLHANRLDLHAARRWVEVAIERAPLWAAAHHLHALILQEQSQPAAAVEALRRCVYSDPEFVLGHFAMAGLLDALGQRQRALKALETTARLLGGDDAEPLEGGDGLTTGRLRQLVALRRELWR